MTDKINAYINYFILKLFTDQIISWFFFRFITALKVITLSNNIEYRGHTCIFPSVETTRKTEKNTLQ